MSPPLMPDASNRTFVCSVVFLDIIEYSKRSVTEQLKLKQRFNALLSNALQQVAVIDRIVLDTGDGAAISFLGNPDDSLFVAMKLRDAIANENPDDTPPLLVRIGINLGPVRLIKDINGQLNIIGDGINVAQRVMSFAEPGLILVSRSYYEVISRMSDDYGEMFRYEGTRTDKHVREHSVYAVAPAARDSVAATPAVEPPPREHPPKTDAAPARLAQALRAQTGIRPRLLFGSLALGLAIIAAGTAVRAERLNSARTQPIASSTTPTPDQPTVPPHPAPAASPPASSPPAPRTPEAAATPPTRAVDNAKAEAGASPASPATATPRMKPREKLPEGGKATVRLVVVPWGEIYVDGQKKGVSPPMRLITVPPGRHLIEIRNSNLPPQRETIDAKAGDVIKLHHRF